jgi:hypothetical protein
MLSVGTSCNLPFKGQGEGRFLIGKDQLQCSLTVVLLVFFITTLKKSQRKLVYVFDLLRCYRMPNPGMLLSR